MVDCYRSIKMLIMTYKKGRFLINYIDNLPKYVSMADRNKIAIDSINILTMLNSSKGIDKMLLVGQVQSGKTNVIVGVTSLAMDNDFDIAIVFGGVNQLLLKQTFERLKASFTTEEYNGLVIITNEMLKKDDYIANICSTVAKHNTKLIIITMKEVKNIENLIRFIENLYICKKKILIIDDEADNASINIGKKDDKSMIYAKIETIFSLITAGVYVGVTATPYANLISEKSQEIYPDKLYALIPSVEYTGLDFFEANKSENYDIVDNTKQDFEWQKTIYYGVALFLVNSFIMEKETKKCHSQEMLINIDLSIDSFVEIHQSVRKMFKKINTRINSIKAFYDIEEIKDAMKKWIDLGIWTIECNEEFIEYLKKSLLGINEKVIILADENNFYESKDNGLQIIIGGSLVSRGFTFNNLLVEIILNAPEAKIPADTLLQRARWFGYRKLSNRYRYMKILMSQTIYEAFSEFECLQRCLFDYIEKVNQKCIKLNPETAKKTFAKYENIVPSNKR